MLIRWLSSPPRNIILGIVAISILIGQSVSQIDKQLTPEERCGYRPGQFDQMVIDKDAIEISVWARAHGARCWRAFLPVEAAKLVTDYKIVVRPRAWANGQDTDADAILQAASEGAGPDIAFLGRDSVIQAYEQGYIEPLDACIAKHDEFDDVSATLWPPLTLDGKRLGIPIEPAVEAFFFSKSKLRDLGWTGNEIDQLPDRIREGQFTLEDMAEDARQAVESGVVRPGLGYWPSFRREPEFLAYYRAFGGNVPETENDQFRLSRAILERVYTFHRRLFEERISHPSFQGPQDVGDLWMNRILYQDAVAHGEVLFWLSNLTEWSADYAFDHVDELGGRDYLSQTVGYALFPSGIEGQSGSIQWDGISSYVILSERATGRQHQNAACALLAKVMTPEIHSIFATSVGTLGVLKSQDQHPDFVSDTFTAETRYFWDYLWLWPQDNPDNTTSEKYLSALDRYLVEVEMGRLPPDAAVEAAVHELQEQPGNTLIVEP